MIKKTIALMGLSVLTLSVSVYGDVPNTFTKGKKVIAAEVNENFISLDTRVRANSEKNSENADAIRAADLEPPQILVDAPVSTADDEALVTVTFTDNQGLFKYSFGDSGSGLGSSAVAYESERSIVREQLYAAPFGQDLNVMLYAHATDLSGNSATASEKFIIKSTAAITPGNYVLDELLDETISGSGCDLQYFTPTQLQANRIDVYGSFSDRNGYFNSCNNMDVENALACITVNVSNTVDNSADFLLGGQVTGVIMSVEDAVFSFESLGSTSMGGGDTSKTYTQMDVEFYDTVPATIGINMTLRCESTQYGTTSFGPYQLYGTLQQ